MSKLTQPFRSVPRRSLAGGAALATVLATGGAAAFASGQTSAAASGDRDPCNLNSKTCQGIGVTDSWYDGGTLNLLYSHQFFCGDHSLSWASTGCEIGAPTKVRPPSGKVVSPIYVMTPIGFIPSNLQCPVVGNCIDHPPFVDASRVFGAKAKNAPLPPHSHIIIDREGALSSWWPVVVIGVTNPQAWDEIAMGKDLKTVNRVRRQHPTWVTGEVPSNIYLFFQAVPGGDIDSNAS
jgi:hypothetical protein